MKHSTRWCSQWPARACCRTARANPKLTVGNPYDLCTSNDGHLAWRFRSASSMPNGQLRWPSHYSAVPTHAIRLLLYARTRTGCSGYEAIAITTATRVTLRPTVWITSLGSIFFFFFISFTVHQHLTRSIALSIPEILSVITLRV